MKRYIFIILGLVIFACKDKENPKPVEPTVLKDTIIQIGSYGAGGHVGVDLQLAAEEDFLYDSIMHWYYNYDQATGFTATSPQIENIKIAYIPKSGRYRTRLIYRNIFTGKSDTIGGEVIDFSQAWTRTGPFKTGSDTVYFNRKYLINSDLVTQ